MFKIKKINNEVISIDQPLAAMSRDFLHELAAMAQKNERKRMRLLSHSDANAVFQEMFIVHTDETYVRPHKHLNKIRTFEIFEGVADMVIFDEQGKVTETVRLTDYNSGGLFYYRLGIPVFYSLVIRSKVLLFKESTAGPFVRSETLYAPWSPDETDTAAVHNYLKNLRDKLPRAL